MDSPTGLEETFFWLRQGSFEWLYPNMLIVGLVCAVLTFAGLVAYMASDGSRRRGVCRYWRALPVPLFLLSGAAAAAYPMFAISERVPVYEQACLGILQDETLSTLSPAGDIGFEDGDSIGYESRFDVSKREIMRLRTVFGEGTRFTYMAFTHRGRMISAPWVEDFEALVAPRVHDRGFDIVLGRGREGTNIPGAIADMASTLPPKEECDRFIIVFTDGDPDDASEDVQSYDLQEALLRFDEVQPRPHVYVVITASLDEFLVPERFDEEGLPIDYALDESGQWISSSPNIAYLDRLADEKNGFNAKVVHVSEEHAVPLTDQLRERLQESRSVVRHETRPGEKVPISFMFGWVALFFAVLALVFPVRGLARV